MQVYSLVIASLSMAILWMLGKFMARKGVAPGSFLGGVIGLGVIAVLALLILKPDFLQQMWYSFTVLLPEGPRQSIEEAKPVLFPAGEFSFIVVWLNYGTGSFLFLIGLVLFIYYVRKKNEPEKMLVVIWTLALLAATISMRRFAYYLSVNVALLTGLTAWLMLKFFGFRDEARQAAVIADVPVKKADKKKLRIKERKSNPGLALKIFGVVIVFIVAFLPDIILAKDNAETPQFMPTNAWYESLTWLRNNTRNLTAARRPIMPVRYFI